jgi:transcription termination factor Rho
MNIENMTSKELKEMAKELKVKNWWNLKKAELIAAIQNAQNESEDAEEVTNEEVIEETEEATQNESEEEPKKEKKPRGKMIEYNGKTQNLNQWAKELGMSGQTLFARIYISNWPIEKAFTTPTKKKKTEEEA